MDIFKYLNLFKLYKKGIATYKEDHSKDNPGWISQRFWGAVVVFIGAVLQVIFNVTMPDETTKTLTENFTTISGAIHVLIPKIVELYGILMSIVGAYRANNVKKV